MLASTWDLPEDIQQNSVYVYLIGSDGLRSFAELLAVAATCEEDVSRTLQKYYAHIPEVHSHEQHRLGFFRNWLDTVTFDSVPRDEQSQFMRFAFALVTGDDLTQKVNALQSQIGVLEDFLRIRFDCLPDLAPDVVTKSRGNEFLKSIVCLRDQHLLFTAQISQLLASAWENRLLCSLVPRLTDREGHFARLLDGGDLTVTLSLQMVDVKEPISSRLSQLTLPMEDDATPMVLLKRLQEHQTKGRIRGFPHSI